jgi:uncharacterized protein YukE
MSITDVLIKIARSALEGVLSQLGNQIRVVTDQALNPARAMVQAVVGGIWRGNGADAFVNEISSLMIPGVGQVIDHITQLSSDITNARDIMDRADESVERLVRTRLFDSFEFY